MRALTGTATADARALSENLCKLPIDLHEFDWREMMDDGSLRRDDVERLARGTDGIIHSYVGSTRARWRAAFREYLAEVHERCQRVLPSLAVYDCGCRKDYLFGLARAGAQIVSTVQIDAPRAVEDIRCVGLAEFRTRDLVVKPIDGELCADVVRLEDMDDDLLSKIVTREPSLLLQPFIPEIRNGQVSIVAVVVDGSPQVSHVILKVPDDWHAVTAQSTVHEHPVEPWMPNYVTTVLEAWPAEIVFGFVRVDYVPTAVGPLLMEVEAVNPALGLAFARDSSARRFRDLTQFMVSRWLA